MSETGLPPSELSLPFVSAALDQIDLLVVGLDREGRVAHCNRTLAELLGEHPSSVVGRDWFEVYLPAEERRAVSEQFDLIMAGEVEPEEWFSNCVLARSGERVLVEWRNAVVRDRAGGETSGTLSFGNIVSGRHTGREALHRLRKELVDLKHAIDQATIVAVTDTQGVIRSVNARFCETSGYSEEELIGRDHRLLNSGYHSPAFFRDMWETIGDGKVWRGVVRNRRKDGSYYWLHTTIVPLLDASGQPYKFIAFRNDISDQIRAEQRARHQQGLAHVGRVAALLASEIDTPLSTIEASLRELRQAAGISERVDRATERIAGQIDQLNRSIRDLRRIAQPRAMSLSRVALVPLLRQAASPIAERPDLDGVEIVIGGEPLVVSGDARLLHDAFQNLLINAGEAVRAAADSGTVRVNVSRLGGACLVEFSDSGPGIDPDDRSNVFRPFFTTRQDHAGLGLAIVRRAVEAHGGEVEIDRSDLGGARIRVTLPLG